jgi:hypothetical protein
MGKNYMAKSTADYLRLAQWAYKKYSATPGYMSAMSLWFRYVDILSYELQIPFETAREMSKDPNFRLPEEEK